MNGRESCHRSASLRARGVQALARELAPPTPSCVPALSLQSLATVSTPRSGSRFKSPLTSRRSASLAGASAVADPLQTTATFKGSVIPIITVVSS